MTNSTTSDICLHDQLICLNHHELIRKYRCCRCDIVVMCTCDEDFANHYLRHQVREATDINTQERIPVTGGFVPRICNRCRGLPEEPHPASASYGRTTKIVRFYWREIAFEVIPRFAAWANANGYSDWLDAHIEHQDVYRAIEHDVVDSIKTLHQTTPKYEYNESSQENIIRVHQIEIVDLHAKYVAKPQKGETILDEENGKSISVEDFVSRYFRNNGYETVRLESTPIHALYAILMWMLFLDPADENVRLRMFGERAAFEEGRKESVAILVPSDFGTPGYIKRRSEQVGNYFEWLTQQKEHLSEIFESCIEGSWAYRNKLWAHRVEDLETARRLVLILNPDLIISILKYLVADFWRRHLGWPDLIVHGRGETFFVEVKGARDRLSEDQKTWISGNASEMHLPFKLIKVHRLLHA